MVEQGRSTLTPDDSGRVLDRLAGLQQVISDEAVRQALVATQRVGQRACKLTHEVTLWRYCQVLCSEFPGLGGVLHDSIDEFLSLQEMKNVFVSVQASPSFLGRLS